MAVVPGFIAGAYDSQSWSAARQQCINLYPERIQAEETKGRVMLLPIPGLKAFATMVESPSRGIFFVEHAQRLFAVIGQTLYEVDSAGTPTSRGTVARDGNPAMMVTNGDGGDELMIVSGDQVYMYDLATDTLTNPESDATHAGMLDGFFLVLDGNTSTLKSSDLLDGTTWAATSFAQRNAAPDPWKAMVIQQREIWLFGEQTSEVWYNAGGLFPFAQRPGAFFERGIVAPYSAAPFDNSVAWLGGSKEGKGIVYRASGYSPVRISTHAIEHAIQGYSSISDAIGWSYQRRGHTFYVLTFPSGNETWVYDAATGQWHQRGLWNQDDRVFDAYRAQWAVRAFNKQIVCDSKIGALYELDDATITDVAGAELRRLRRGPHLSQENRRLICHQLELEMERGVGTESGQGTDPQIVLRSSRDGGQTWCSERWQSAGKMGEYLARARWHRMGAGRDWVFEVSMSDPAFWAFTGLYGEFEPLGN